VATVRDGDTVRPRLSPDGVRLAYSRVVVKKGTELCELVVRDLRTGRSRVLLTAEQSRRYATYAAFVVALEWIGAYRLRATVADGDVDATLLTFDTRNGKLLRRSYELVDDLGPSIPPSLRFAMPLLSASAPKVKREVFESALQDGNGAFAVGKRFVVFQHNYADFPIEIQFADLAARTIVPILEIPDLVPWPRLIGGFGFSDKVYYAVDFESRVALYETDGKASKELAESPIEDQTTTDPVFKITFADAGAVVFSVQPRSPATMMNASLWIVDADGLTRVELPAGAFDVDIRAGRIAIGRRERDTRIIEVFGFKPRRTEK
jgi:hypothetical protein